MIPSHSPIGTSADQFSVAVHARVSRDASNASQSETRPGLLAGSGTAVPVEQVDVSALWAEAERAMVSMAASRTSVVIATAGISAMSILLSFMSTCPS